MALNYKSDLSWLPTLVRPSTIVDVATTGTLNNVATSTTDSVVAVLRFTGAAPTVTGLQAGRRLIYLMAAGGPLVLANESGSSLAANRIVTGTGGDATIAAGAVTLLIYDPSAGRWRMGGVGADVSTVNGASPQAGADARTTDATPTNIGSAITLPNNALVTVDVSVQAVQDGAVNGKIFAIRRSYLNTGGVVTDGGDEILITEKEMTGAVAASFALVLTGTTVQPKVTGVAGLGFNWYMVSQRQRVAAAASAALPAPTVTSLSPNTGSTAGGTATTITGTGFVNGATVTIGGAAATGVTWVNATSITCTTPAGAAGAQDVVVTNPDAQTGTLAGGFTYSAAFARESLALQVFLSSAFTNYSRVAGPPAVGTFAGVASAGASGGRNFVDTDDGFTEPPGTSAPLNGRVGAAFAPATLPDRLNSNPVVASDVYSASTYSGWMLINATSSATDNPDAYDNDSVIASYTTSWFGLVLKSSGKVVVYHYDGTDFAGAEATFAFGTPQYVHWKFTGGSLKIGVNGTWGTPVAKGNVANLTEMIKLGRNPADARSLTATLYELAMTNTALSDADLATNVKGDINTDFGLAL